tara:strand:+ start:420 stop:686 length:267 start_codon:yes stop_codon:yes gene_type:complete
VLFENCSRCIGLEQADGFTQLIAMLYLTGSMALFLQLPRSSALMIWRRGTTTAFRLAAVITFQYFAMTVRKLSHGIKVEVCQWSTRKY